MPQRLQASPALRVSKPFQNNELASVPSSSCCTGEMSRKVLWAHTHQMDVLLCSPLTENPTHTVWIIFIVILITTSLLGKEAEREGSLPLSGELIKSCESSRLLHTLEMLLEVQVISHSWENLVSKRKIKQASLGQGAVGEQIHFLHGMQQCESLRCFKHMQTTV